MINDSIEMLGVYDSGSNVSLINSKFFPLKQNPNNINNNQTNLRTINGVKKSIGVVTLTIKIFEIETKMNVFVIEEQSFDYDFLVGLDCIKRFQLAQNEKLEIMQIMDNELKNINHKIIPDLAGKSNEKENFENESYDVDIPLLTKIK